ncbi:DUF1631 family protein [Arhodomonas sp. AD133]|uniref:DUF1631 family protein n=1 Tax=Arhodomonas sp. AD133 TaxID=3415009 RepID=UPI003EC0E345
MSRERRAYERHPVRWDARLLIDGAPEEPAVIEDVCAGGFYLALRAPDQAPALTERTNVRVRFRDPLTASIRTLAATVARRADDGVGVAFSDGPHPDVVTLLSTVGGIRENGRGATTVATPVPVSGGGWLRELCHEHVQRFAAEVAATFTADLTDQLFDRSRAAANVSEQSALFRAYRTLRDESDDLPQAIVEHLCARIDRLGREGDGGGSRAPSATATSPDELELVDEREFDDWLLRSETIGRAESRYSQALDALNRRFNALLDASVDERSNPLAPDGVAKTFADRARIERFPGPVCREFYRVLDRVVLARLGQLYDALNEALRRAGVIPDAEDVRPEIRMLGGNASRGKQTPSRAVSRQARAGGAAAASVDAGGPHPPRSAPEAERIAAMANRLQAAPVTETSTAATGGGAGAELVSTLSAGSSTGSIATGDDAARDAPGDGDDRVRRWFAQSAEDASVSPFLREQMADLATLAEREQSRDGRFLTGTATALNALLDQVDRAGVAMMLLEPAQQAELRESLEAELAGARDQATPAAMQAAAEAIAERVAAPLRTRASNMARVSQQCEGEERLERARRTVDEALAPRVDGREIPQPVAEFLDSGWKDLMTLVFLRHGTDSDTWRRCLAVVDRLLTALGRDDSPPRAIRDPERVIAYAQHQLKRLGRLSPHLADLLHTLRTAVVEVCRTGTTHVPLPRVTVPGHATEANDDSGPEVSRHWMERARLLQPGDWVLFDPAREDAAPLRLQWVAEDNGRLVFVDRAGHRADTLALTEMAERLSTGARVVDDLDAPFTQRQWRQALVNAHDALVRQATHDPLTGLLNRKAFTRALERLPHAGPEDCYTAVQLSLDGFRGVNAELGHDAGDRLLRRVSRLVARSADRHGIAARTGGDEFTVVFQDSDPASSQLLAERLRRSITRLPATGDDGHRLTVRATAAAVTFTPDTLSAAALLGRLDELHQAAREDGGNRLSSAVARPETTDPQERNAWLEQALTPGALRYRVQRIQPLGGGSDDEQRWQLLPVVNDRGGYERPAVPDWLPANTRQGELMSHLDRSVIERAIALHPQLGNGRAQTTVVHVQLSPNSLFDPLVWQAIEQAHAGMAGGRVRLCLELTESMASQNLIATARFAERARDLGADVGFVRFGTALATFDLLKRLPVNVLKLDELFVSELDADDNDQAMVRTITELVHLLERQTIATGVERSELFAPLRRCGVDYVQGHAVERPQLIGGEEPRDATLESAPDDLP